jgi:cyclopropane-fatty-acyl-phospholipid synthase
MACHAPETVTLLGSSITSEENAILSCFSYHNNKVYLHRDPKLMPSRKSAWSSWNFMGSNDKGVFVTYWLNRLQNLDEKICQGEPVLVSLNPSIFPRAELIEAQWTTGHPVPTIQAVKAQRQVNTIHGTRRLWFAGAYMRFGFHEDGVRSGLNAAHLLLNSIQNQPNILSYTPKPCITAFQIGWIESSARLLVKRFLSQFIIVGKLELREIGGQAFVFEGKMKTEVPISSLSMNPFSSLQTLGLTATNSLHTVLEIVRASFYSRVAARHDLGLADAFIDGDCRMVGDNSNDLVAFFELLILNREAHLKKNQPQISTMPSSTDSITGSLARYLPSFLKSTTGSPVTAIIGMGAAYLNHLRRNNTVKNTRNNIKAHYDASNEMFSLFLDETMTYSAGIFKSPTDTLYQSQVNKLETIIRKLRVRSTDHVLEIGFGWGSLSMALVRM